MKRPCPEPDCDRRSGHKKRKHRCHEYGVDHHGPYKATIRWTRPKETP
ncbi:MAG TPA: hypothetical protein VFJ94_10690 [Intrasporangium sp.]|nr:hypothetical protein [Intrasporangium sp.]HET7398977.1 hypothetical protein [Intrasporangium sp.]